MSDRDLKLTIAMFLATLAGIHEKNDTKDIAWELGRKIANELGIEIQYGASFLSIAENIYENALNKIDTK